MRGHAWLVRHTHQGGVPGGHTGLQEDPGGDSKPIITGSTETPPRESEAWTLLEGQDEVVVGSREDRGRTLL